MLNVYAPKGTQMLYVEPFSHYGASDWGGNKGADGLNWDGITGQKQFGTELETLLQQGTQFRITNIYRPYPGADLEIGIEVIDQSNVQLWHP